MPLNQGCQLRIHVPKEMANDMQSAVQSISTSGLFGEVASLPFSVSNNHLVVKNACSSFSKNEVEAVVKINALRNPPAV